MFEIDCDDDWNVTQEADNLTKSLFGGNAKRKTNKKGSKNAPSIPFPAALADSDEETFTKKEMKKLKEKRRRNKKQAKKGEEEPDTEIPSDTEHIAENGADFEDGENVASPKISKAKKRKKSNDMETVPEQTDVKAKKSTKRKREPSEENGATSTIVPDKKRKKAEEADAPKDPNSPSAEETPKKKRRRNRKKKNNSKKNKYAHLALNRKGQEAKDSTKDNSESMLDNENANTNRVIMTINSSKKLSKKKEGDHTDKEGKICSTPNDHSQTTTDNGTSTNKIRPSKMEDGADVHGNPKKQRKKAKLSLKDVETESANPVKNVPNLEKVKKRKAGPPSTEAKKVKTESAAKKQTSNQSVLSDTKKKKMKDNFQKGNKVNGEDTALKDLRGKVKNVKGMKTEDSKNMLELQQRQKTLLKALIKSGKKDQESTDLKEKKKKKNKKQKSSEAPSTEIQGKKTKAESAMLKEQAVETPVTKSGSASAKSQVDNSTAKISSIWGLKASTLGNKAQEKLNAARFRYLNEQLYTCQGRDALQLFREDRDAFEVYHSGFENQASKWPVNPVDVLIKQLKSKPPNLVVADFGCGDAKLAQAVPQKVHSFDLVALNPRVKACDMSNVPLKDASVDIVVFCLSLMGTNLDDYIREANRVLKINGLLKIVEVVSRFNGLSPFLASVCSHGYQLLNKRDLSQMFYLMDFKKLKFVKKGASTQSVSLKPCVYKKR